MAFNFGAFIGGASENLVQMIKTKEAQLYKEEQDEKERLRQARVAAANQRRADDKAAREAAQKLKLAGFDSDRIAYALKEGSSYADGLAEYGMIAIQNGKDPNTLLKHTSNIDQFKKLTGHPGIDQELRLPEGFTVPKDSDISTLFEQDREVFTTLSQPASKPVTSLQAVRANVVNDMLKLDPTSTEYQQLSEKNEALLKEIKREQANSKDDEKGDPVTSADARQEYKLFLDTAAKPLGIETLNGDIVNVQAGNQGKAYIAQIRAGINMKNYYKRMGVDSSRATSMAQGYIDENMGLLQDRAKSIAYAARQINQADKQKLSNPDPDVQYDMGLVEKFKMPWNSETQNYKESYTLQEAASVAKSGALDYGDVIIVDNKAVVFTGLNIKYSNWGENVTLPWVYANDESEDEQNPNKYVYTGVN